MEDVAKQCPLVQFSQMLFSRQELAAPLSTLQQQGEFNLNIVFYLLWAAKACHGRLTKRQLKSLQLQVVLWHQRVILELKYTYAMLARHKDSEAAEIKQAIQEEILRANAIEQHLLFEAGVKLSLLQRTPVQQLSDACTSFMNYCSLSQLAWLAAHRPLMKNFFSSIFEEVPKTDIDRVLGMMLDKALPSSDQLMQPSLWE